MSIVRIVASFYNTEERLKFEQNLPSELWFHENDRNINLDIPYTDFKTYMLFPHQDIRAGLTTFTEICESVDRLWAIYDHYCDYDPDTQKFTSRYIDNNQQAFISEALGVGGALSTIGKLYDLHHADWNRIPIQAQGLDFYFDAANVNMRIVIEAKGNISDNNQKKNNSIYQHKKRILEQKDVIKDIEDFRNSLLIGVITAADPNNCLRSYLIDPPIEAFAGDLKKLRLLHRLNFYYYYLTLISPRSNITVALANRIMSIELTDEYEKFNRVPLLNAQFNEFEITKSYFNNKTSSLDNSFFGKAQAVDLETVIFIGLTTEILNILLMQNFEALIYYKEQPYNNHNEIFHCVLSISSETNNNFYLENDYERKFKKRRGLVKFVANTEHFISSSGLNFCKINSEQIVIGNTYNR